MLSGKYTALVGAMAILLCGSAPPMRAQPGVPLCESRPPYFLVMLPHAHGDVSGDLLVKYGLERHRCEYRVEPTDYQLQRVTFNRFVKVVDTYLFLGGGSAPVIGEFAIYNLKTRSKLYEHRYMGKNIRIEGRTVIFTEHLGNAKPDQCKDYDKIVKLSLTPTLEADVSLNLDDLAHPEKVTLLVRSKTRCVATQ
jgi:hypothetical protein